MKKVFTKAEKQEYYQNLRDRWQEAKVYAETEEVKSAYQECLATGLTISLYGFAYCKQSMEEQGLEGTPYIDAKTFQGWKQSGFVVKKGEKSKINGLTWVSANAKNDKAKDDNAKDDNAETGGFKFPKVYRLFHRSQVEPIGEEWCPVCEKEHSDGFSKDGTCYDCGADCQEDRDPRDHRNQ